MVSKQKRKEHRVLSSKDAVKKSLWTMNGLKSKGSARCSCTHEVKQFQITLQKSAPFNKTSILPFMQFGQITKAVFYNLV